jgi:hypothetical protein
VELTFFPSSQTQLLGTESLKYKYCISCTPKNVPDPGSTWGVIWVGLYLFHVFTAINNASHMSNVGKTMKKGIT